MEGFCRGCLIKYDEPMELLQYTEKNRRLFVYSTGLQVKRNDTFTFQLCKDCFLNMKLACKFKKLCRTSDKRFKNYLAIKDIGAPVDFCTFLKNSDDTLTFRLPMTSGNSTPANQKCRDDDNESTCTSIRNFMTDILQGEEMPDTEARIIREVIEEEADVLDDSLDSHWMQDDMSIDTDFRLDFNNLSPFSTPRSVNNDRCFTPKKYANQNEEQINFYALNSKEQNKIVNDFTNVFKNDQNVKELCHFGVDDIDGIEKSDSDALKNDQNVKDLCDFDVADIDGIEKSESDALKNEQNVKDLSDFDVADIDSIEKSESDTLKNDQNMKELCHYGVDEIEKPINNIDMPSLDDFGIDKSMSNIDMPSLDDFEVDKSMSNIDLPQLDGIGVDKSMSNIDLPSLDSFGIDKSVNNIDIQSLDDLDKNHINIQNFYTTKDDTDNQQSSNEINNDSIDIDVLLKDKPCSIDRNLEKALKNEGSKEFSLDDLLVSPPGASAASTPTITNILFGEKLELSDNNIKPKPGQCMETFEDAQGDIEIFEEFFQNDTKEFDIKDIMKENVVINNEDTKETSEVDISGKESMNMDISNSEKDQVINDIDKKISTAKMKTKYKEEIDITTGSHDDKFDLKKNYCYLCNKKFKDVKALSIHFAKKHLIKIVKPKIQYNKSKLCNICGKDSIQMTNFNRHLKTCRKKPEVYKCDRCQAEWPSQAKLRRHMRTHTIIPEVFKCDRCPIECTSEANLKSHMGTHGVHYPKKDTEQKYVCTICGEVISKRGNYSLHLRRHTKNFTTTCEECGKGFYRASDLKAHMRRHTGETPYKCAYCDWSFTRRDVLNRHIKLHMDEKLYQCEHCDSKYVTRSDLKRHVNSKICLKKLGLIHEPTTNMTTDTQPEEQVNVTYTTGNKESIRSQLPFLETEMSN